jgi:hypothetical protein
VLVAVAGKAAAAQPRSRSGKKASKQAAEQNNKRVRVKAVVRLQSAMRRRLAKRTVAKLRLQAKQSAIHSQAEVLSGLRERWEANLHAASRPGYVGEMAAMARDAEVSQREAARRRAQLQERTEQEHACRRRQQQQQRQQRLQQQRQQQLQQQRQQQLLQGQLLSRRTIGDNEEQKELDEGSHSRHNSRHGTEQWRHVHASIHASTLPSTKPMRSGAGQAVGAKHRAGNVLSASELFLLEEALILEEATEARHASTLLRHQPQASARSRTPRVTPRPRDSARTPRRRMPVIMPHQSSVALRVPHEASQPGSPQVAREARAESRAAVAIVTSTRIQQVRQRAQQVVAAWVESTLLQPLAAAGAAILPPPPLSTPVAVAAGARAPPSRPTATARAVVTPGAAPHSKPSVLAQRMCMNARRTQSWK